MLLYFNGELLKNVSLSFNSDNSIQCLYYNGWKFFKSTNHNTIRDKKCPCVSIPNSSNDTKWEKCQMGYINIDTLEFIESEIILEYVVIKKIFVQKKNGKKI